MKKKIKLTNVEIQSKLNRQNIAERLISQLSKNHDGRNTWLLNYGIGDEAVEMRKIRGLEFIEEYQACETVGE